MSPRGLTNEITLNSITAIDNVFLVPNVSSG